MKQSKFTSVYSIFVALSIAFLLLSSSGGRSGTWANAPGDSGTGYCNNCHTGVEAGTPTGGVSFSGLPSSITAGMSYDFTVSLSRPTSGQVSASPHGLRGGFQLTATDGTGTNNTLVGTFNPVAGEVTELNNVARLVQDLPQTFGTDFTISWDVNWTAPVTADLSEDVTFYLAGNAADGNGSRNANDYSYANSVTVAAAPALPVEFLSFKLANQKNGQVLLQWQTATELHNDYMAIERSSTGKIFREIGRIAGAGNSNEVLNYEFMDKTLLSGTNYYRIKQVNYDGTTDYSKIISTENKENTDQVLSIYPTMQNSRILTIELPESTSGNVEIQIFSMNGQLVFTEYFITNEKIEIATEQLSTGMYIVKLSSNEQIWSNKFIK